jgi:hypothetical protein
MTTAKVRKKPVRKKGEGLNRPYRMPATASELNVSCAECGEASEWFDPSRVSKAVYATDRASDEHRRGFICGQESRSSKAVKLLIQSEQGIIERAGKSEAA